ncbi:MAG: hypothetical protein AB7O32_08920 [Vicinamibacterales bacterium]
MKVTRVQRILVLVTAVVAVGAAGLQATGVLGLTPAEFAAQGAGTVRAASYAFGIWSVIYAALLVYAVYQLVPGWSRDSTLERFGWPSAAAMLAVGLWLVAAGANWRWATVALIVVAALAVSAPLASSLEGIGRRDRLLIVTPLALLAGWLTIASGLNAITVLTAEGLVSTGTATWWALGGLAASVAVTLIVFVRGHALAYPVPVIWGLIAVFVAERGDRPQAAWFALAMAVMIAAMLIGRARTQPWPSARRAG